MTRMTPMRFLVLILLCMAVSHRAAAETQGKLVAWMAVPPAVQQTVMENVGAGNRMDKVYYVTDAAGTGTFQAVIKKGDGTTATIEVLASGQLVGAPPAASGNAKPKIAVPFEEGNSAYNRHDYDRAIEVLTPWARQGDQRAQVLLGTMYLEGYGTDPDSEEARKWFKQAAMQGNVNAQYNMGILSYNGDGGEQDDVDAYMWFALAQRSGHKMASKHLKTLLRKMSPDAVKEGQSRASSWKPETADSDNQ